MTVRSLFRLLVAFVPLLAVQAPIGAQDSNDKDAAVDQQHAKKMAAGLKLFQKEVSPVFRGRCLKCHGGQNIEGDLSLASREGLLAGGQSGPAIVVGKSKNSLLYRMINHEVEPVMPEDGAKLDDRSIDAIARWIDLGAPYDRALKGKPTDPLAWTRETLDPTAKNFWSFQPLKPVDVPSIQSTWAKTEIDRFVLARLKKAGLAPNRQVKREQLARRMYLDVIGLPPTPKQISRFANDRSPTAVDSLVEELLESSHFGEKWARHWLDVARFAESHGFEQDYDRPHAYHFRDFVIKAFNRDLPYDQFIRWQIAGDELSPKEPLALMATGFLGAGAFPTQLTEKEFESARYDELDDMASTIGTAMLGLTIGCARCHDHKFDPIPQRDYYQFISAFTTTIRTEVELELDPDAVQESMLQWQKQNAALLEERSTFESEKLKPQFSKWLNSLPTADFSPPTWVVLDFQKAKSVGGATFQQLDDGSLLATGKNPEFDRYEFVAKTGLSNLTAIRIEALAHESLVKNGPGRASNGNFALSDLIVEIDKPGDSDPTPLKLVRPRATFQQNQSSLSVSSSLDGNPKTGWAVDPKFGKDHAAIFEFESPVESDGEVELTIRMNFGVNNRHSIGRPKISITDAQGPVDFDAPAESQNIVEIFNLLKKSGGDLTQGQQRQLFRWYRTQDSGWRDIQQRILAHAAQQPRPKTTRVMISSEGLKPLKHNADGRKFPHFYPQTHFLGRGDVQQKQGVAEPGLLQIFQRDKNFDDYEIKNQTVPRLSYRRSKLAHWMTDTENGPAQQVARVIVNRIWQQYFGRGIVATPNDFGFQGKRPTHPELLDWLAATLIQEDWSLKSIHRLILSSAVYQQSSRFDPRDSRTDPDNQLLWRFSPRRLQAELIRDSMLSVSGTLDPTMFGPGTLDQSMKRRSIYFMIKRSRLIPMLQIFDSPEPLVSVGVRPSTTIAPQALMFMNNSNVREYARNFSRRLSAQTGTKGQPAALNELVDIGFKMALGRSPTDDERQANIEFIEQQMKSYQSENKANSRELAVTDFCHVLFCLNEFIYVD